MATIQAFNEVYAAFTQNLTSIFTKSASLKALVAEVEAAFAEGNTRYALDLFMKDVQGHDMLVMRHDEDLFARTKDAPFLGRLGLLKRWPKLNKKTQEGVWYYLQNMFLLGTGISKMTPQQLDQIEAFANKCAAKLEGKNPTPKEMQDVMFGEMGDMFKSMGMDQPLGGGQPDADELASFLAKVENKDVQEAAAMLDQLKLRPESAK